MLNLLPYRELIFNFIKRDIFTKYSGSFLGIYWSVVNPLITLVIYIIVFGVFLQVRLPNSTSIWDFSLYFAAGFIPWMVFQNSVMRGAGSIVDNKHYIKKVPFPSEILPIYTTFSEFVNLFIGLAIYFLIFLILKGTPTMFLLFLPLAIILQLIFTLSLSFFLSSGAVYFRDIPQILNAVFMIWFWITPIAYTLNLIPESIQWIERLNPAYYMLEIYRDTIFYGKFPEPWIVGPFLIFSLILFFAGIWFFQRTKRGFGELL